MTNPETLLAESRRESVSLPLIDLSLKGLSGMYDGGKGLFCFRTIHSPHGLLHEGVSLRYTLISLIGLCRAENRGYHVPLRLQSMADSLLHHVDRIENIGDLGLLLWLCSVAKPDKSRRIVHQRVSDVVAGNVAVPDDTTELSWLLTGLSSLVSSEIIPRPSVADAASKLYLCLKRNYGGHGIFRHQNQKSLAGFFRGRIGTFADQVYPICALSSYARAFDRREALDMAVSCAKKICELQGPLGQWWWYYDSARGETAGSYPVYSVHQDGMAPMALLELQRSTGLDFSQSIYRGLQWIFGNNELLCSMVAEEHSLIWRCIHFGGHRRDIDLIKSVFRMKPAVNENQLSVLFECRPYHLGWLLYAFA